MERMKKRKDGRYEISIVRDGKRKTFYARTQGEVRRKVEDYEEEKEAGPLFSTVADEWETAYKDRVEPNTYKTTPARVRAAKERFKDVRISSITPKQVSNYVEFLAAKKFTRKTVEGYLSILRMIFRQAVIDGHIDSDPSDLVQAKGKASTPRELPSDEDILKVVQSKDAPFWLFAHLVMHTGLRRGEALALTYQDIDRENNVINITKAVYFDSHKQPHIKDSTKTKAGMRHVPILPPLLEALPNQDIGYIFPNKKNTLMTEGEFDTQWEHFVKATGITCTPHQLRHVMATFCFEAGLKEKDTQDILGHADIATTHKIYTHIRETRRQKNYDKLSDLFSSEFRQDAKKVED